MICSLLGESETTYIRTGIHYYALSVADEKVAK